MQQEYSLMILDVNLPDGEGFGFCKSDYGAQESEGHVSYGKRFGKMCYPGMSWEQRIM